MRHGKRTVEHSLRGTEYFSALGCFGSNREGERRREEEFSRNVSDDMLPAITPGFISSEANISDEW